MVKLFRKLYFFIFKKAIDDEVTLLKNELEDLQSSKIEEYLGNRLLIDTSDGFQIKFLGELIVKLLAKCFWILVKDSENYLVFTFKDHEEDTGVDVIIVKEGQLTPLEKIEDLEKENTRLREEIAKNSN